MDVITLTFGERAENHVGMQIVGADMAAHGFSVDDLINISESMKELSIDTELIMLGQTPEAAVLVLRNPLSQLGFDVDRLTLEQNGLNPDKKAKMRGRVVNKRLRYNLCFDDKWQDPNYELGMGTIISYDMVPELNKLRLKLGDLFGDLAVNLKVEANYYYDLNKCGINFHGDSERKIVIALRLGQKSMPIFYQWYQNCIPQNGHIFKIELNPGDMYIMSENATGFDWKKRKIPTLRHAAGLPNVVLKNM